MSRTIKFVALLAVVVVLWKAVSVDRPDAIEFEQDV